MTRTILVPLDGSPFSEHALPLAAQLARRAGARLHLLHVLPFRSEDHADLLTSSAGPVLSAGLLRRQRAYLDGVAARLGDQAALTADLIEGEVAQTIRAAVSAVAADLVVMTTHGRGPLQRLWLGSVADALLRDLSVPLLLVRPTEDAPDWKGEPGIRHLLVPLDGSPLAEQVIEPAVQIGTLMQADYTLLRVVAPAASLISPIDGGTLGEMTGAWVALLNEATERHRQLAVDYLEKTAAPLRARRLAVQTRVVVDTSAATAILEAARPPGIDGVALATHGRHGLPRLVLGSVADKIIRAAALPVLVYRPMTP